MPAPSQSDTRPGRVSEGYRGLPTNQRSRWIREQRGDRNPVDPNRAYAALREWEALSRDHLADVWTVFLTNRECPWRCLMCDLWKNTLTYTLPAGASVGQLDAALALLKSEQPIPPHSSPRISRHLKIYNSGSFFDPQAIPPEDHGAMAERALHFERLVVECHPRLVGERVSEFQRRLAGAPTELEVAMGLETAHPATLERLNKHITVAEYQRAAEFLRRHSILLRTFLLVHPPLIPDEERMLWLTRSIATAFDAGSAVVSLIPTRTGNGALEALQGAGEFNEPSLLELEDAFDVGLQLGLGRGRVFVDLWDLARFSTCPHCLEARAQRLHAMNLSQEWMPRVRCLAECATPGRA